MAGVRMDILDRSKKVISPDQAGREFLGSWGLFRLVCFIIALLFMPSGNLSAQLSPGELHQSHADLEGLKNCGKCHDTGNKVTGRRCLECHILLGKRIESKTGLHANEGFDDCTACHVEHLGRNGELVWWNGGIENFDHSQTKFGLVGKHKGLECRKCHNRKNITDQEALDSKSSNPDRTFLGLSRTCKGCHADEHRGQTPSDCLKCHDMDGWKPAPAFDHRNTNFPLTGKHLNINCDKCHNTVTDNISSDNPDFLKFTGIKHDNCLDCHRDIHNGKFKQSCESCHNTSGWRGISGTDFDHGKTAFQLEGRHAKVACEKCHPPGKPLAGLKYSLCTECHPDYHRGQFARRESGGECKECHTVDGFTPAIFGIDSHNKTDYPLSGAHLAIPCVECHPKIEIDGSPTIKFSYESTRCIDCHKDPHKGAVDKYLDSGGCELCHKVDGWKYSQFDHEKTGFSLSGRHTEISCLVCHKSPDGGPTVERIRFVGPGRQCPDCHQDTHMGQFEDIVRLENENRKMTDCGRCHTPSRWKADKFSHDSNSSFKLEGAHAKTPCAGCHKSVVVNEKSYILYKPIEHLCSSCHKADKSNE